MSDQQPKLSDQIRKADEVHLLRTQADIELSKIEANAPAKEVASKTIGKYGLFYITLIVCIGVGSSYFLSESAITAVMTMVGGALVALIQMLQGITGTANKEEKPEFKVINDLIQRLDKQEAPMRVDVEEGRVTVSKGDDTTTVREKGNES
jgi:hypothetical protein